MTRYSTQIGIKFLLVSIALCGAGWSCKQERLADPNEASAGQLLPGDILLRNVNEIANSLDVRLGNGELDKQTRDVILFREVKKLLKDVKIDAVPAKQAWQYGDAYRMANDWASAQKLYEVAVKTASTNDRKVNDTLRLARVQAHFGDVDKAIATCRSTFTVDQRDRAPIMMAILYEVVPEAAGKSKDKELAKLLEDAIGQHESTLIDLKTDAGKQFLRARPIHVHNAWLKVAQLYQSAGMVEDARRAIEMDEKSRGERAAF